jgi:hypothetical protein
MEGPRFDITSIQPEQSTNDRLIVLNKSEKRIELVDLGEHAGSRVYRYRVYMESTLCG